MRRHRPRSPTEVPAPTTTEGSTARLTVAPDAAGFVAGFSASAQRTIGDPAQRCHPMLSRSVRSATAAPVAGAGRSARTRRGRYSPALGDPMSARPSIEPNRASPTVPAGSQRLPTPRRASRRHRTPGMDDPPSPSRSTPCSAATTPRPKRLTGMPVVLARRDPSAGDTHGPHPRGLRRPAPWARCSSCPPRGPSAAPAIRW